MLKSVICGKKDHASCWETQWQQWGLLTAETAAVSVEICPTPVWHQWGCMGGRNLTQAFSACSGVFSCYLKFCQCWQCFWNSCFLYIFIRIPCFFILNSLVKILGPTNEEHNFSLIDSSAFQYYLLTAISPPFEYLQQLFSSIDKLFLMYRIKHFSSRQEVQPLWFCLVLLLFVVFFPRRLLLKRSAKLDEHSLSFSHFLFSFMASFILWDLL